MSHVCQQHRSGSCRPGVQHRDQSWTLRQLSLIVRRLSLIRASQICLEMLPQPLEQHDGNAGRLPGAVLATLDKLQQRIHEQLYYY